MNKLELIEQLTAAKATLRQAMQAQSVAAASFEAQVQAEIAAERATFSKQVNANRADSTFRDTAERRVQARLKSQAQSGMDTARTAVTSLRQAFQDTQASARRIQLEPLTSPLEDVALTFGERALLSELRRTNRNLERSDAARRAATISTPQLLLDALQQAERAGDRLFALALEDALETQLAWPAGTSTADLAEHLRVRAALDTQRDSRIDDSTARTLSVVDAELTTLEREMRRATDLQNAIDYAGRVAIEAEPTQA